MFSITHIKSFTSDRKRFINELFYLHDSRCGYSANNRKSLLSPYREAEYENLKEIFMRLPRIKIDVNKIYNSDKPLQKFLEFEKTMDIDYFQTIFWHYVNLEDSKSQVNPDNIELIKYIINDYNHMLLLSELLPNEFLKNKNNNVIKNTHTNIEILKVMTKYGHIRFDLSETFKRNFILGNCDVVSYILDNFTKILRSDYGFYLGKFTKIFKSNNIDCFNILLSKLPFIFEKFDKWVIECDLEIAKILIFQGFGSKINPYYLLDFPDFLFEQRYQLDLYSFVSNYNSRKIYPHAVLRLILILKDFTDHENIIKNISCENYCDEDLLRKIRSSRIN